MILNTIRDVLRIASRMRQAALGYVDEDFLALQAELDAADPSIIDVPIPAPTPAPTPAPAPEPSPAPAPEPAPGP